jgi:hypothetical protein
VAVLLAVAAAVARAGGGSASALSDGYRMAMGITAGLAVVATAVTLLFVRDGVCREHHQHLRRLHLDHPWPLPALLGSR